MLVKSINNKPRIAMLPKIILSVKISGSTAINAQKKNARQTSKKNKQMISPKVGNGVNLVKIRR
jgi:hypothetical protein